MSEPPRGTGLGHPARPRLESQLVRQKQANLFEPMVEISYVEEDADAEDAKMLEGMLVLAAVSATVTAESF